MPANLFNRLPEIWKDLDLRVTDVVDGKGFLERFLNVPEAGFARIENLIAEFLRVHNIEEARERYIPLFDAFTGHRWKSSKAYQWNRNRSQVAVTRASYKGSDLSIKDLAREHGATYCEIIDMASKVFVWSRQGTYTNDDIHYYDADYYHPGVFQLFASDDIDWAAFQEDFQYIQPAGTKWYFRTLIMESAASIEMLSDSNPMYLLEAGHNQGYNVYTEDFNYYDFVPQAASDFILYMLPAETATVMNARLTVDSMTFYFNDPEMTVVDEILDPIDNIKQPAVEPVPVLGD